MSFHRKLAEREEMPVCSHAIICLSADVLMIDVKGLKNISK